MAHTGCRQSCGFLFCLCKEHYPTTLQLAFCCHFLFLPIPGHTLHWILSLVYLPSCSHCYGSIFLSCPNYSLPMRLRVFTAYQTTLFLTGGPQFLMHFRPFARPLGKRSIYYLDSIHKPVDKQKGLTKTWTLPCVVSQRPNLFTWS